jgi:hypothetical protein
VCDVAYVLQVESLERLAVSYGAAVVGQVLGDTDAVGEALGTADRWREAFDESLVGKPVGDEVSRLKAELRELNERAV